MAFGASISCESLTPVFPHAVVFTSARIVDGSGVTFPLPVGSARPDWSTYEIAVIRQEGPSAPGADHFSPIHYGYDESNRPVASRQPSHPLWRSNPQD